MDSAAKIIKLESTGSAMQRNRHVRKIYTALEAMADGGWEVVTVIETDLVLDARSRQHDAAAADQLIQDVEADARTGLLVGRVIVRGV